MSTINHCDCLEFLSSIQSNYFQLIITSPPYNIGKSYEQKQSLDEYFSWQKQVIKESVRVLKDSGSVCWQVGNFVQDGEIIPLDILFYPLFKGLNLKLRNRIIWHYPHGLHTKKRLSGRYETILWFTKTDDYVFNLDAIRVPAKYPNKKHYKGPNKGKLSCNPKGKNPSDLWKVLETDWYKEIWDIPNVKHNHAEKTSHPCQFPVELVERLVLALSNEGDDVYDPFGGVGSTVIAALKNNRIGWMTEKDENYVEIAKERIASLQEGKLRTREIGTTCL